MRSRFTTTTAAALLMAGALAAPTATAHTAIKSTRPGSGSTVKQNITVVAVIFDGDVRKARLVVTGPGGKSYVGSTARDPRNARRFQAKLNRKAKPGSYKVRTIWTAADGHPQQSTWSFKVKR